MTNIKIKESQLHELCCNCLRGLNSLNIKEDETGKFVANQLLNDLSNILIISSGKTAPPKNSNAIAFSLFSAWFAFKLIGQLGSEFEVKTKLNKASSLSKSYREKINYFANITKIKLTESEFLIDYYVHPQGHLHCPILTVESESRENGLFFDLSKLLLVSSPRRVYVANIENGTLDRALSKIKDILNEASASGVIHNSDQIVLVLYKDSEKEVNIQIYDYDQYRHISR